MKPLLYLLCLVAVCGCAGMNAKVTSSTDRFAGKTINETINNDLPLGFGDPGGIYLDMRQETDEQGKPEYFLILSSVSLTGWQLFPNITGNSLYVLADNTRLSFASSSHQGVRYFYPATEQQLQTIANATNVEIRVVQITGTSFEKKCTAKNRQVFKKFGDQYLK